MTTEVKALKVLLKNFKEEYLVPWTETKGQSQYVPFAVNTGDTDSDGNPAFITTDNNTLTTSGTFVISTASGEVYKITDTLTCSIEGLSNGTYNILIDPALKTIGITTHDIYTGTTFPSTAQAGDYLYNTSKLPYDFQQLADSDGSITTGLTSVWVGMVTITSGIAELTLRPYNQILEGALSSSRLDSLETTITELKSTIESINTTVNNITGIPYPNYTGSWTSCGTSYTATADGWISWRGQSGWVGNLYACNSSGTTLFCISESGMGRSDSKCDNGCIAPCRKGDRFSCTSGTIYFQAS